MFTNNKVYDVFKSSSSVVVYCYPGSYAKTYCTTNSIDYRLISTYPSDYATVYALTALTTRVATLEAKSS